jgi:hypothetical protein
VVSEEQLRWTGSLWAAAILSAPITNAVTHASAIAS